MPNINFRKLSENPGIGAKLQPSKMSSRQWDIVSGFGGEAGCERIRN